MKRALALALAAILLLLRHGPGIGCEGGLPDLPPGPSAARSPAFERRLNLRAGSA
ncbi:MAG: hypothetical protein LBD02_07050 [Christensenellaceae bacterium]|nr:hypothetical protein [Christensenellaceae bacterium]